MISQNIHFEKTSIIIGQKYNLDIIKYNHKIKFLFYTFNP